jgi:hypothetical protein
MTAGADPRVFLIVGVLVGVAATLVVARIPDLIATVRHVRRLLGCL